MSIFGKVKQALGFSEIEDEDYFNSNEDAPSAIAPHKKDQSSVKSNKNEETVPINDEKIVMPQEIFDGVIKIFNESLPDFLKSSVDIEAQRQYIYNSLDDGLKTYLNKLSADVRLRGENKWKDDRNRLQTEISQLKERCKSSEEQRSESQKLQLSAERQKRALNERLHDLEKQIANLEAEKEQYDLENKSLINKLKVSSVIDGDLTIMRQEIADKDAEILALKEHITKQCEDATVQDNPSQEELDHLNEQISKLTEENSQLNEAIEQLKAKEAVADAMINDLNAKASEAIHNLEAKEKELTILRLQKEDKSDTDIEVLKQKLSLSNEELASTREELEEARASMQVLEEIQEQISLFEEIKKKKDERIAELQEETKQHLDKIVKLEKETISLKKTIETNLYKQAENEQALRIEIENLKTQKATHPTPIANLDNDETVIAIESKRKKNVKISAIDESLDDTDWLVATPPPGTVTRPTPSTTDEDFGYQSPARKSTPNNDAQMSLF